MENDKLDQVVEALSEIKKVMNELQDKVESMENRLNGLGKVDSIEHRVTSNQIDITDIKEALERMEEQQNQKIENMLKNVVIDLENRNTREFSHIHRRLDTHLLKLGKMEEEVLILKKEEE